MKNFCRVLIYIIIAAAQFGCGSGGSSGYSWWSPYNSYDYGHSSYGYNNSYSRYSDVDPEICKEDYSHFYKTTETIEINSRKQRMRVINLISPPIKIKKITFPKDEATYTDNGLNAKIVVEGNLPRTIESSSYDGGVAFSIQATTTNNQAAKLYTTINITYQTDKAADEKPKGYTLFVNLKSKADEDSDSSQQNKQSSQPCTFCKSSPNNDSSLDNENPKRNELIKAIKKSTGDDKDKLQEQLLDTINSKDEHDCRGILGMYDKQEYTLKEITAIYRLLTQTAHPDKVLLSTLKKNATEAFKRINPAYECVKENEKSK